MLSLARFHHTRLALLASLLLAAGLGGACGSVENDLEDPDPSEINCPANGAQILVYEGFFIPACGCAGAPASPTTNLSCTVSAGTPVLFSFITDIRTQLTPVGTPAMPPVIPAHEDGQRPSPVVIRLDQTGTYEFQNATRPGVIGRLIVQ